MKARKIKYTKVMYFMMILVSSTVLFSACNKVSPTKPVVNDSKEIVINIVKEFGSKLQNVSLLAPKDILEKSMKENYSGLVTQELIQKWISDPLNAPGRLTSSPWPDRIEILSAEKISEDVYKVEGVIIEITSVEKESGGFAAKRPITLIVKKIQNQWLIAEVTLETYEDTITNIYENIQYGFNFYLPESWRGYTIVNEKWEGLSLNDSQGEKIVERGPKLSIRHPLWSSQNPRQDIPILIFTIAQWNALQQENFHIGAAPIGPSELGRNSKYVFALPARYNFAFPEGYEEVEDILKNKPLKPTENIK